MNVPIAIQHENSAPSLSRKSSGKRRHFPQASQYTHKASPSAASWTASTTSSRTGSRASRPRTPWVLRSTGSTTFCRWSSTPASSDFTWALDSRMTCTGVVGMPSPLRHDAEPAEKKSPSSTVPTMRTSRFRSSAATTEKMRSWTSAATPPPTGITNTTAFCVVDRFVTW